MNSLLSVIASIGPGKASKLYRGLSICQLCGCSMYPPSEKENFCWVFELPLNFPSGFTFPNALPVEIMLIDYFHPIPFTDIANHNVKPWPEYVKTLKAFLGRKVYIRKGFKYLLITKFNKSFIFVPPVLK